MIGRKAKSGVESDKAEGFNLNASTARLERLARLERSARRARRARNGRKYGSNVKVWKPKLPRHGVADTSTIEPDQIITVPGKDGAPPTTWTFFFDSLPYDSEDEDYREVIPGYRDVPGGSVPLLPVCDVPGGVHKQTKVREAKSEAKSSPAEPSHRTGFKIEQAGKAKCLPALPSPDTVRKEALQDSPWFSWQSD